MAKTGYQSWRLEAPGVRGRGVAVRVQWLKDRSGAAAAEFAMILPVLLLVFFAIIQFGITLNNYIELTNAAVSGARQASVNRGSTTPYSTTVTAIDNGAPNLTAAKIAITMTVAGAACTSDGTACQSAFGTGGGEAKVTLTYPCNLTVLNAFVGVAIPTCVLTSSASELVE